MRFHPGMIRRHAIYVGVVIKEVYYPEEYKDNLKEDYAFLVLMMRRKGTDYLEYMRA
jgi:hypothetical protein